MKCLEKYPELTRLLDGADHVDVKIVEGTVSLRQFIAAMLSYYPWWIVSLYYVFFQSLHQFLYFSHMFSEHCSPFLFI